MGNKKSVVEKLEEVVLPTREKIDPPPKREIIQQVQLPVDILLHIFFFLPSTCNLTAIALSCRQFFELLRSRTFLRHSFFPYGSLWPDSFASYN